MRAPRAISLLLLAACGNVFVDGSPAAPASGGGAHGGGSAASGGQDAGAGGGTGTCTFAGTLQTGDGPCAGDGLECDAPGEATCGACAGSETCFANRCYRPQGPPPTYFGLMRGLFATPEGERCLVAEGGVLERVEAALWVHGVTAVTMDVYISCGDTMVKAATVSLPAAAFPVYVNGPNQEQRSTTFVVDPPLALAKGDTVAALFHAEGALFPDLSAVEGVYLEDVEPGCVFTGYDAKPGIGAEGGPPGTGDYMARFYIH